MFKQEKQLLDDVKVDGPNPNNAAMIQEQLCGPHGELRAAMQYIISINKSKATGSPGVIAVITGEEYPQLSGTTLYDRPSLAVGKVRYCGEPVAMVVADEEFHSMTKKGDF